MKLFAFGSNGSGQLAIGHTEDVSTPTECLFETTAPKDKITSIIAGGNHTLLLTESGNAYAAGCNNDGRCGPIQGSREAHTDETLQLEENILCFRQVILSDSSTSGKIDKFKRIAATWEGSILVPMSQDKVYVLGSASKGELGLGKNDLSQTRGLEHGVAILDFPPKGTRIASLASGMGHAVAILSNGEVYGWGGSRKGQLGDSLKAEKIIWSPAKVEGIPFHATGAVCGREFTVILGQRNLGEFVLLGDTGNRWGIMNTPESLQSDTKDGSRKDYLDIQASWHGIYAHVPRFDSASDPSCAGVTTGSLVAWGRNDRGQLPPPNFPPLLNIGVGSEHVLALLEDGSVATFGWGEHGNCGLDTDSRGNVAGTYKVISLPGDLSDGKVLGVGAGCATSWLIVE